MMLQLLAGGLVLVGAIALWQDRLLYFPERVELNALLVAAERQDLRPWPAQGELRGLVREPAGPARATLVLFHGNAGHAGQRAAYGQLARLGVRVILAEYPGYGPRPGQPGEETLTADAAETILQARREFAGPLLLAGESLGAGVAAAAYARVPQAVDALWLITPWDSLVGVAAHHYPWLPVDWLLRDRYDSQSHLAQARGPVAVVLAERDTVIPPGFGRKLYEGIAAPKQLWTIPGAGHNDWMAHVDARWWEEVANFLVHADPGRD